MVARQHADDRLDGARRAHHVPVHRLGRADHQRIGVLAEDASDRSRLDAVVEVGARAVRVDVVDLLWPELAACESALHRLSDTAAIGGDRLHVEGIAAGRRSHPLGVDARAARLRVLKRLEDERAGALAEDEAGAVGIEGPDRHARIAVVPAERAHGGESGVVDRLQGRLEATGDDDVGRVTRDQLGGLADGRAAGCAGGGHREVGPACAEGHRDHAGRAVGQEVRDQSRRDAAWPFRVEDGLLFDHHVSAAHTGAEDHSDARRVLGRHVEAGVGHRLLRGRQRVDRGALELPKLLAIDVRFRVEVRELTGDWIFVGRGVERLDGADAGAAGGEALPRRLDVVADGRQQPEARHDNSAHEISRGSRGSDADLTPMTGSPPTAPAARKWGWAPRARRPARRRSFLASCGGPCARARGPDRPR